MLLSILFNRWSERMDKIDTLALVCEHVGDLSVPWRCVLGLYIFTTYVLPVLRMLLYLEEDRPIILPSPEHRKQVSTCVN
jgi:hypothetical protein